MHGHIREKGDFVMYTSISPSRRLLHSWKEISAYTGRGVRTIQRYEVQFGFPVHRPAGSPRSAVLAFTDEIDQWLAGSPKRIDQLANEPTVTQTDQTKRMHSLFLKAQVSTQRAQAICQNLSATKALLDRLNDSLQRGLARRTGLTAKLAVDGQSSDSRSSRMSA